jgi:hypothetical protein
MACSPLPGAVRTAIAAGCLAFVALLASAQSPAVDVSEGLIRVRPAGVTLLDAMSLERLKVGALVQLDVSVAVLPSRGGTPVARRADTFRVSYDLWEERFAVRRLGPPTRSASHAAREALDAWCLAQLAIPVTELSSIAPAPFWIRLQYDAVGPERAATTHEDDPFMLSSLIDLFSRRRSADRSARTIEAGPFGLAP